MTLQLKSVYAWHVHVENKAPRILQTTEKQEFLPRSENLDRKAHRSDQSVCSPADRSIIVYKRKYSSHGQFAPLFGAKVAPSATANPLSVRTDGLYEGLAGCGKTREFVSGHAFRHAVTAVKSMAPSGAVDRKPSFSATC